MSCDVWLAKLDAYIDAELPADEMNALERHLRTCASCAAESLTRMQLKRLTYIAGKKFTATPEFRSRIEKQVSERKRFRFSWNWAPVLAAAAIVIFAALLLFQVQRSQQRHAYSELADLHVADLASANPVDVVSSDRHTVKPWFQGRIPFAFNLPELANTPFTLIGGRVAYFQQSPGAHLLYEIRKHKLSVFIFEDRAGLSNAVDRGPGQSFTARTWTANGLRFFLITDAPAEDADRLRDLFVSASRS
jgi:anti-sigma factor RsiW